MGCLLPGCMAPSRGNLEDRHGSGLSATVQRPGWGIGGLRIAIEAFSYLWSLLCSHSERTLFRRCELGGQPATLPVEPASLPPKSARVIRSGVEPRSRLGEMDPSTRRASSLSLSPRQARSSRR